MLIVRPVGKCPTKQQCNAVFSLLCMLPACTWAVTRYALHSIELSKSLTAFLLCLYRSRGEQATGVAAMEVQSRIGKNVTEDPRSLPPVVLMDED